MTNLENVNSMETYAGDFNDDFLDELEETEDQSKESVFERELPEAGICHLRFVSYIELGDHTGMYQGMKKKRPDREVKLGFEVVTPKHTNGKDHPILMSLDTLGISCNAKSKYHKLFKAMVGGDDSIKHLARCLGKSYIGKIFHVKYKNKKGEEVTYATLKDPVSKEFSIKQPIMDNYETGESTVVKVAPNKSPIICFVWNKPLLSAWNAMHIDGTTDDGRSKNWMQERCLEAENFKGSPLQTMLMLNNLPTEVEKPEEDAPAPDVEAVEKTEVKKEPAKRRHIEAKEPEDIAKDGADIEAMAAEAGLLDD